MVYFTFFAPSGKILKRTANYFQQGHAEWKISADEFDQKGVIFYRFENEHGAGIGKMILVK